MPSRHANIRALRRGLDTAYALDDAREADIRKTIVAWGDEVVPCSRWEWIICSVADSIEASARDILALHMDSRSEFFDWRKRLSQLAGGRYLDRWCLVTKGLTLERDHLGFPAQDHAEAARGELERRIESIDPVAEDAFERARAARLNGARAPRSPVKPRWDFKIPAVRATAIVKAQGTGTFIALAERIGVSREILYRWRKDRLSRNKGPNGVATIERIEDRLAKIADALK